MTPSYEMNNVGGLGPKSSPNSVSSILVTKGEPRDIRLSLLPYASGRHVMGVFLELLPGDGPFQRFQLDPQHSS